MANPLHSRTDSGTPLGARTFRFNGCLKKAVENGAEICFLYNKYSGQRCELRKIQPVGPYRDIVEARSPDDELLFVKLGLREESFQQLSRHNLPTAVAQYYGLVQDGLPQAVHAFKGLNRPLMLAHDMEADKNVVIYTWRPVEDYVWMGGRSEGKPVAKIPPPNRVFVVLVREENADFPRVGRVIGSVEKWNWVKEDPRLPHAPVDWESRYNARLWSRTV